MMMARACADRLGKPLPDESAMLVPSILNPPAAMVPSQVSACLWSAMPDLRPTRQRIMAEAMCLFGERAMPPTRPDRRLRSGTGWRWRRWRSTHHPLLAARRQLRQAPRWHRRGPLRRGPGRPRGLPAPERLTPGRDSSHALSRQHSGGPGPAGAHRPTARAQAPVRARRDLVGRAIHGGSGVWALLWPSSFADAVDFGRHTHFVHDAGAFQIGIGCSCCWRWPGVTGWRWPWPARRSPTPSMRSTRPST
jgi:hypothetical protein